MDLEKLSVESLTAALEQTKDAALRARAQKTGDLIRAEDGVGQAVQLIERHASVFKRAV